MITFIKYLLSDTLALNRFYQQQKPVTLSDIRRHLMLIARQYNKRIPDHIYRLGEEKTFEGIITLSQLFTEGLKQITDEYLDIKDNVVHVKACKQNEWQLLLTLMPPLLLVSRKICQEHSTGNEDIVYLEKYIAPNVNYTAIPSPDIPQISDLRKRNHGLHDMHIHLNGSIETDITWQDLLANSESIAPNILKATKEKKVQEQFDDILGFLCEPKDFFQLLKCARIIRNYLYIIVLENNNQSSIDKLLRDIRMGGQEFQHEIIYFAKHPMRLLVGNKGNDMQLESLLYCKIFDFLSLNPGCDLVANLFLYYLLILGVANRMLVQQTQCNGFEEFQKYTMNGVRWFSEKQYMRRFLQLSGNNLNNIRIMEGKFSPKSSIRENEEIVGNIRQGVEDLNELQISQNIPKSILILTAHFIKEPDRTKDALIRHKILRRQIMQKAKILGTWHHLKSPNSRMVLAIDAAASELDTPPEVFAPAYHYLRKEGFKHFSYHAGEDFFHILSGMRAVYEAIDFLGMTHGDRIGHATACGLSIHIWRQNIGPKLLIRKGEWMDDLIFAAYIINKYQEPQLLKLLPIITIMVSNYSQEIYNQNYSLSEHIRAWQVRKEAPERIYWNKRDKELSDKYKLYMEYHKQEIVERYDKIIEIDSCEPFGEEGLEVLQKLVLRYMHEKEIVIEMLPTSNVLISHHHDFSTYHFSNWLKWQKDGYPMPAIILGTDDPGIFATNIYNEYCNIFCHLVYHDKMNSYDALKALEQIDYNSRIYAFKENFEEE